MKKNTYAALPLWEDNLLHQFHRELIYKLSDVRSSNQLLENAYYKRHQKEIETLFYSFEAFEPSKKISVSPKDHLRITAWNIERGMAFDGVLKTLLEHPEIYQSDILLLTEVDYGMARSKNLHVAKELCKKLNRHGVFAPAYLNLDKGNGAEVHLVKEENTVALQGHAILSKFPLTDVQVIHLPNAKDHLAGKERQIGQESVLLATAHTPFGEIHCAPVHLAAHSSRAQRVAQMKKIVEAFSKKSGPAIMGGDWNTTTYNAHKAYRAILSFWRRVAMGVHNTVVNHYPYPERYFEKKLFRLLTKHSFETEAFNVSGGCTLHYDFTDPFVRKSLEDWLPQWCFPFIDWALKPKNGVCSFKLDWLAGRKISAKNALIIQDLPRGEHRFSDHDPILADIFF